LEHTSREAIIAKITHAAGRKLGYHFTRASNLPAMAHFDELWSRYRTTPVSPGERRETPEAIVHDGLKITVNAHLRIPESMMAPGCTVRQFRAFLDKHVFIWPTRRDCLKMLETYRRREPGEQFAVLALDAAALLAAHFEFVRLSKYDSGSAPRYPQSCTYRKSPQMLLPLAGFGQPHNHTLPAKASEIKEILIEDRVSSVSRYLRAIYVADPSDVPEEWRPIAGSLEMFAAF
jgi:hypothetical protein